ncbi:MAG: hypothetical protein K6C06_01325 [Lachnospiraceae bacterium]|nr:hypothetical protein [Lachnospiraceae bacterium]
MNDRGESRERIFHETELKMIVRSWAEENGCPQTLDALAMAERCHAGQFRKVTGKERVPFIHHPLILAAHAIRLGIADDTIAAACLLHDVCEDCGIGNNELPVGPQAREIVGLLTKDKSLDYRLEENDRPYYEKISENPDACMVKILDRCNNISEMSASFPTHRMREYMEETERYVMPLFASAETKEKYQSALFLVKYHMKSVLEAQKRMFREIGNEK